MNLTGKSINLNRKCFLKLISNRHNLVSIFCSKKRFVLFQVSKKNLMEIVKKLMVHMERAEGTLYRDELLTRIIEICSQNNYQHVVDFEWYVTVLAELTEMETSAKHGQLIMFTS